ncbi:hypothetical protein, partial [Escherichia coli]|uniref:hypothetical protein n=1 Tax=Escherichia coli TaxID=562 RepID=UPI002022E0B9
MPPASVAACWAWKATRAGWPFGDSALYELDRQSLAHFCRMREEHPQWDHAELFKASRPRVRQNRLLMNKP